MFDRFLKARLPIFEVLPEHTLVVSYGPLSQASNH